MEIVHRAHAGGPPKPHIRTLSLDDKVHVLGGWYEWCSAVVDVEPVTLIGDASQVRIRNEWSNAWPHPHLHGDEIARLAAEYDRLVDDPTPKHVREA